MPDPDRPRVLHNLEFRRAFADTLGRAVAASGLPLTRIQNRLQALGTPVTVATLSYWQSGRSLPSRKNSLRAVANLEAILRLTPGTLTSLLTSRHSGDADVLGTAWRSNFLARAMKEFGLAWEFPLQAPLVDVRVHVTQDRRIDVVRVVRTIEATTEPISRLPLLLTAETPPPAPRVEPVSGFMIGREFRDNLSGVSACEAILERTIAPGERLTLVSNIVNDPDQPPNTGYEWGLPYVCHTFRMGVSFAGEPPTRASAYGLEGFDPDGESLFRREVPIVGQRFQFEVQEPGSGVLGALWNW